jgi:3alpha(or 20beta)-hydroxysteroid dehydrogenase
MDKEFIGKNIVVTGAASGLGRAVAMGLAGQSAKVWVVDISIKDGNAVADQITAGGGSARFYELNVADPEGWERFSRKIADADGVLHGLVNNAGVGHRVGIVDTTVADWQRVLNIDLSSVFYGMKFLAPLIGKAGGGAIVNVSSVVGMIGYFAAAYCASKWGVRGLSKVGAMEFAGQDIRVNSIHPGLIDTPLLHSGSNKFVEESLKAVPARRPAKPVEIADAVSFLLSDKSRYITGTEIVVDGGLTSGGIYYRLQNDLKAALED